MEKDIAVAVAVSILLWKDATPEAPFPPIKELVKIDLGRILSHKNVMHSFSWLRGTLGPFLMDALHAEPWHVKPRSLMRRYIDAIPEEYQEGVGKVIRESTFEDPAFSMLIRRGNPFTATAERVIYTSQRVAKILGVDETCYRAIEEGVRDVYYGLFRQVKKKET